jgi:hypothetical protein
MYNKELFGIPILVSDYVPKDEVLILNPNSISKQATSPIIFKTLEDAYVRARRNNLMPNYVLASKSFLYFLNSVKGHNFATVKDIKEEEEIEIDESLMKEYEAYLASEEEKGG